MKNSNFIIQACGSTVHAQREKEYLINASGKKVQVCEEKVL
jgi:hypothetical protein